VSGGPKSREETPKEGGQQQSVACTLHNAASHKNQVRLKDATERRTSCPPLAHVCL